MIELGRKKFAYASLAIAALGMIALISNLSIYTNLVGAIILTLGVFSGLALYKYGYLIIPWLTSKTNKIVITDSGYEIPPSQDVIVTKHNEKDIYYASVFLSIKIHKSATEMSDTEIINYNKQFERAMASFKNIVKISYLMYALDISQHKKELEAKKAEIQLLLQKEREKTEPDILKIERYERELSYYENQLNKLIKGRRPMAVTFYAMTTAAGITKDEAIAKAKQQASELKTILETSLNASVEILTADEMLKAFNWETFLPTSLEELENEVEEER